MEAVRREAERADHVAGLVLLQSLAGGTGSGFGSRIAEEIADAMPTALRLSCAVWPHASGEVVVQARLRTLLLACSDSCSACPSLPAARPGCHRGRSRTQAA